MTYTQLGLVAVAATVVLDLVVLRTRLLSRRAFWVSYVIVVFFQLLTNGVLTGFRIVRYRSAAIVGDATPVFLGHGRIVFAPFEDLLFGFALVASTMALWVWWGRLGLDRTPMAGPPRLLVRRRGSGAEATGPDGAAPRGDSHREPS
jgi:lycopene cyclase domain-containing protein